MAEIANSTVFTNDIGSFNTPDLLQQAFQEAVEQDNHDNEFVTFLAGDGDDSQAIHLTHAQASALRLTFQVDSTVQNENDKIIYQDPNDMLIDIQCNSNKDKSTELNQVTEQIELPSDTRWTTIDDVDTNPVKTINITNLNNQVSDGITCNLDNHSQPVNITGILLQRPKTIPKTNLNGANHNYNTITDITPTFSSCGIANTQNQTVTNRLPVIFPSSQYIIKPAQTILKSGKNIRLISTGNNNIGNTISSMNNSNGNITTQNSVLLPKTTLMNTTPTQIIKTTPITTQLIHGNAISAQLLDSSQILTCDMISNANINNSNNVNGFTTNGVTRTTQNLGNNSIRMSPLVATTSTLTIQRDNIQQTSVPSVSNTTNESNATVKSYISNGTNTNISGTFFKSLQIPTQVLKTTSVTVGKSTNSLNPTKVSVNPTSSIILKNGSRIKAQQLQRIATSTSAAVHRTPTQTMSTPISILKPQTKVTLANSIKQNSITNSQNVTNVNSNYASGVKLVPKMVRSNQIINNQTKLTSINDNKLKSNELSVHSSNQIVKKPKLMVPPQTPSTLSVNDAGKPLGSNENPIQIVQQGHTFHSMQKLTQSQLKQIAHVLQQRSQESTDPNERVVYRVVFPEELDLRIRNPINLLKGRPGKRGRPKKKPSTGVKTSTHEEDGADDVKDERKKPVARTRSGRLSRPPRHIVRDYKHLHHVDLMQVDLDDSDGGYSDYNISTDKLESDDVVKDLLTGYEGPKRKISDHFRCPTCNKIYLGRTRMAKHFEIHPDHGSADQLPPRTVEQDLKSNAFPPDPFKRKGKKRGPWAYITPEAKSERRQLKLKDALSACDNEEIIKIAAKPVLNAQSLFDLMVLKSNNCLKTFLNELSLLVNKTREQVNVMLSPVNNNDKYSNTVKLDDKLLCDTLNLAAGLYYVKDDVFNKSTDFYNTSMTTTSPLSSSISSSSSSPSSIEEPPMKVLKVNDDGKENIDNRLSSGISDLSDLKTRTNLLDERNLDSVNADCPEVLTALTLMPRSSSPATAESCKPNNVSKLLISNTEIQSQISDNPGFQKIDINNSKNSTFKKLSEINSSLDVSNCSSSVFPKLENHYEQSKIESMPQAFIKLEQMQQGFVKLKNGNVSTYQKEEAQTYGKNHNDFDNADEATQTFAKGYQKLISKIVPMSSVNNNCIKSEAFNSTPKDDCKLSDSVPIIRNTNVPIITATCDASLFGSTDNLDITKMTNYDLDILSNGAVIDKHLIMDEKLVEQLHMVDQSKLVDELVSERLKNIMPDNILDSNLMANNTNLDTELDFEALSEEFNRNTNS
ncbi:hypothetical protein PV328_009586 [Microctonus aethiopoides]|uniref:C2H2-type domain-containing protein n=2 Tax=Microctonus aethiopoides TaxID=144406 RepID=A0AA39C6D6_9HYME|nr:hypothetical protein PV328_009586 [Microctonus aethiopoides]